MKAAVFCLATVEEPGAARESGGAVRGAGVAGDVGLPGWPLEGGGVAPRGGMGVAATVWAVHSFSWSVTASCGGTLLVRARRE